MSRGDAELAALVLAVDGDDELQLDLGRVVGRFRARRDREIQAREAAQLLPTHGADAVAERQGCHRVTVYRRARRAVVALRRHLATEG